MTSSHALLMAFRSGTGGITLKGSSPSILKDEGTNTILKSEVRAWLHQGWVRPLTFDPKNDTRIFALTEPGLRRVLDECSGT